jgi:hypothetical protein
VVKANDEYCRNQLNKVQNQKAATSKMKFSFVNAYEEGLAHVGKNGKHGFIDQSGKIVIPLAYDNISYGFSEGLAAVKKNDKWGISTNKGR